MKNQASTSLESIKEKGEQEQEKIGTVMKSIKDITLIKLNDEEMNIYSDNFLQILEKYFIKEETSEIIDIEKLYKIYQILGEDEFKKLPYRKEEYNFILNHMDTEQINEININYMVDNKKYFSLDILKLIKTEEEIKKLESVPGLGFINTLFKMNTQELFFKIVNIYNDKTLPNYMLKPNDGHIGILYAMMILIDDELKEDFLKLDFNNNKLKELLTTLDSFEYEHFAKFYGEENNRDLLNRFIDRSLMNTYIVKNLFWNKNISEPYTVEKFIKIYIIN